MPTVCKNISNIDVYPPLAVAFGQVDYAPGGTLGPRLQPDVQMVMIDRGSLRVTIDGAEQVIAPGEVACHWPGQMQYYRFAADEKTTHRWVALTYGQDASTRDWLAAQRGLAPSLRRESVVMHRLFATAMNLGPADDPAAAAARTHLALAYYAAYMISDTGRGGPSADCLPRPIAAMQAAIANRYPEPIMLDDLADAAAVSPHHLVRSCRKHLGTTPMRLLWDGRVDRGVDLIRNTGLTVSEIAYRVGFANPFHFSRLCKKKHGLSPRKLREQAWRGRDE